MSVISIPNTFTVGAVIVASQHNSNFSIIYSDYNGNITDANIAPGAAISDSKLNQLTTAGKVSGSALTSFTSIPSGAGVIPAANLPSAFTTQSIVTGSRTNATPYQNTSGKTMFVHAAMTATGANFEMLAYSDAAATPTTVVGHTQWPISTQIGFVTFMVLNNNYYKVSVGGGGTFTAVSVWTEWY